MSMKSNRSTSSAPVAISEAMVAMVSDEQIREHAYEIFQARRENGNFGDSVSDWLQAERKLRGPVRVG